MNGNLIIKNGLVVGKGSTDINDIIIEDGIIKLIDKNLDIPDEFSLIDASNKIVLAGGIDSHVHFGLRVGDKITNDNMETGSIAAIAGGITTVIDYTDPVSDDKLFEAYKFRRSEADNKIYCDYSLHSVITEWNDKVKNNIDKLLDEGVTSFKVFMVYNQKIDEESMIKLLEYSTKKDFLVEVHCESPYLLDYMINKISKDNSINGMKAHILARPPIIEYEAIERACAMAEVTNSKLHIVHISTGRGGNILKRYRENNKKISGETAPQYLFLNDEILLKKDGHLYASCPQIKKKKDNKLLKEAIINGYISFVATDHCIFSREDKNLWNGDFTKVPYGLPGVETSIPLIYTNFVKKNVIDLKKFTEIISLNPARRFGMYPKKGIIHPGSDGDIFIIDPNKKKKVSSDKLLTNLDYSPYEGLELYGFSEYTILRGEIIYQDGKIKEKNGRYIKRGLPQNI